MNTLICSTLVTTLSILQNKSCSFHADTTNNLLSGGIVDVSSPNIAVLFCKFQSGFIGSAHCTVQYGTDPTYMNLPYSAESTETGTAGDTVSVVLRERLNSSTVYHYTVSAVSEDVIVVVLGSLTTPKYCKYLKLTYSAHFWLHHTVHCAENIVSAHLCVGSASAERVGQGEVGQGEVGHGDVGQGDAGQGEVGHGEWMGSSAG